MFRWLNGPGAVFRDPLPGSTNYLNAYDPNGNLIRTGAGRATDSKDIGDEDGLDSAPGRNSLEQNIAGARPIPPEMGDDLMPFPLNRQFKSQPVLSDEMRDEIYRRISVEGKSVRTVSAELRVTMERVGAVFRLKTIENQWIQQVRDLLFGDMGHRQHSGCLRNHDDETKQYSISLQDFPVVTIQPNYNSLTPIHSNLRDLLFPAASVHAC